jgi:hypothetical protein
VPKPRITNSSSQKPTPTKLAQSIHSSAQRNVALSQSADDLRRGANPVLARHVSGERSAANKWSYEKQPESRRIQANKPNDESTIPIRLDRLPKATSYSRMTERDLRSKPGKQSHPRPGQGQLHSKPDRGVQEEALDQRNARSKQPANEARGRPHPTNLEAQPMNANRSCGSELDLRYKTSNQREQSQGWSIFHTTPDISVQKQPLSERSMRSGKLSNKTTLRGRPTGQDAISRNVGNPISTAAQTASAAALAREEAGNLGDIRALQTQTTGRARSNNTHANRQDATPPIFKNSRALCDTTHNRNARLRASTERSGGETSCGSTRERTYHRRDPDVCSNVSSSENPEYCAKDSPRAHKGMGRELSKGNDSVVARGNHEKKYADKGAGVERSKYS